LLFQRMDDRSQGDCCRVREQEFVFVREEEKEGRRRVGDGVDLFTLAGDYTAAGLAVRYLHARDIGRCHVAATSADTRALRTSEDPLSHAALVLAAGPSAQPLVLWKFVVRLCQGYEHKSHSIPSLDWPISHRLRSPVSAVTDLEISLLWAKTGAGRPWLIHRRFVREHVQAPSKIANEPGLISTSSFAQITPPQIYPMPRELPHSA
jgi:hypothetical protein